MASRFNSNVNPVSSNIGAKQAPAWALPTTFSFLSYAFYGSLLVLAILILLIVIHVTVRPIFSFTPTGPGIIPVPTPSDKQTVFKDSPAGNDMSGAFTKITPCGYTISMDLYLTGKFVQQTAPRIIMYNALTPVAAIPTKDSLATDFPHANLILWLDPVLNDLYATVITLSSDGTANVQTTKPIVNVPMKSPFRVAYVYNQNFLEVYANGHMETSMNFNIKPRGLSSAAPFFFGHVTSRSSCLVGHASYWARELTSREVMADGTPQSTVAFFNP